MKLAFQRRFLDDEGNPLNAGRITLYAHDSDTPLKVYYLEGNDYSPAENPLLSFLSAGIVNFFVPSGGGQWAVQGPIMMPAGQALGIDAGRTAMAVAWGDQWTNMIQPFWALPALGIAKLSARVCSA